MLIKSKGKRAFTKPRYAILIPNDKVCRYLVIRSGCEAWRRERLQVKNLGKGVKTMMMKRLSRRSDREKQWTRKHGEHYKVCWNRINNIDNLDESIDTGVLVLEAVARLKEQFTVSDSPLTSLANELCNAKELLSELVECRNRSKVPVTFARLNLLEHALE